MKRDKKNRVLLNALGWKVIVIWECETKTLGTIVHALKDLLDKKRAF